MFYGNIKPTHIHYAKDIFNQLVILHKKNLTALRDHTFFLLDTQQPHSIKWFTELQKIDAHCEYTLSLELKQKTIFDFDLGIQIHC